MYLTGVIGKFLGNRTGSLDHLNLSKMWIIYPMVKHNYLDFAHQAEGEHQHEHAVQHDIQSHILSFLNTFFGQADVFAAR